MGNDSDYLKRHDYLDFNKVIKGEPKLTIKTRESIFEYLSSDGNRGSDEFKPKTSEYRILAYLVDNLHNPVDTSRLIDQLNDPRKDAEGSDNKQRVRDKIKAITRKLGKGLIKRTTNGYVIDCKVIRI